MSQLVPERRSRLSPERWEPLSELEQMTDRMRRMLDQTFGGIEWPSAGARGGWSPPVDIEETDDAFVVEAELPGVKREDVDVELVGSELTITGEIKEHERKGALRKQTRRRGRFEYRVGLPDHVNADQVDATRSEGVLTLRVPKAERAQRRKIELKQ
jgi:HSP20 family protein